MDDYTPNSNKFKKEQTELTEKKKVDKVVTGSVKTKKKSDARKVADIFVSEDISNVKSYIFMDVLVPAIKKAISDIVTNGVDMILYGESGRSRKNSSSSAKISYRSYYDDKNSNRNDRRDGYRSASNFDYDDIVFDNRGDAEMVLTSMDDIIGRYGFVSVGDLYDLANITTTNYMVNRYGWTSVSTARVVANRDGYVLKLPKALPLN